METINAFDRRFPDDDACKAYLAAQRWPDGVRCPRCNRKEKVYAINSKLFHWRCRNDDCGGRNGYKFSVITHTIFQDTKIPMRLWFKVAFLILTSKKGISALQIHRVIFGEDSGSDYRTSWFMCMRWRAAMKGDAFSLTGEIEVDETFAPASRNRRRGQGRGHRRYRAQRNGRGESCPEYRYRTLDGFVRQVVDKDRVDVIATDEHLGYRMLSRGRCAAAA
jgi:hypothetical protein